MHKFILSISILLHSTFVIAQNGYLGLGYNANFFKSENLDFVIDRYNETRVYLDETMEYPHFMDGFEIHVGASDKILFDFGFSWRSATVFAMAAMRQELCSSAT